MRNLTMLSSVAWVLAVTLMSSCYGDESNERDRTVWRVSRYPDPMTHPSACGRDRPSYVCDPNHVLPIVTANEIDEMLKTAYEETNVPCYLPGPQASSTRKGYLVMVAALKKMEKYHTVNRTDTLRTRYNEARFFAAHLGTYKLWGKHSSNCSEITIILYSQEDNVLYTMTQPNARLIIDDGLVQATALRVLRQYYPFNDSPRKAANAIKDMVSEYSSRLRDNR